MSLSHVYVVMFNRVFEASSYEHCTYQGKPLIRVTALSPVYTAYWDILGSDMHTWMRDQFAFLRRQYFWFDEHHVFATLGAAKQYYHDNYP